MNALPKWTVLLLLTAGNSFAGEPIEISEELAKVLASRYPRDVEELRLIEAHVRTIAERATPATVGVEVGQSVGSGVIVSAAGLVLTAAHVVGEPDLPATILLPDGRRFKGRTLGTNHVIDAGMVQLAELPNDLPFLPIANETRPAVGDWVIATGQPGGLLDGRAPPVRLGRVLAAEQGWVCTDCTLVGGDSGGPLINMRGEVTAIHTSIGPLIRLNFHVPIALMQEEWQRLLDSQTWGEGLAVDELPAGHPVLGIAGRTSEDQCLVTDVLAGFPAERAGVKVGDRILKVDGHQVNSFAEVARRAFVKLPGERLRLELQRDGESIEIEVVLWAIQESTPDDAPAEQGNP